MPREIAHWEILEACLNRLNSLAPPLYEIAAKYREAAYMGAIAPDIPYYYALGRSDFEHVAEAIHGSNAEDTLEPIRKLALEASLAEEEEKRIIWAFLVGYISHCEVDIVFHPVIYYLTGDYYHPDLEKRAVARTQHRGFEVFLDSWWLSQATGVLSHRMKSILSRAGKQLDLLISVLNRTVRLDTNPCWREGYRHFSWLQALFFSNSAGVVMRGLNSLLGGRISPSEALFSSARREPLNFFDNPIVFKNPVSGIEDSKTVLELREKAIERCVDRMTALVPLVRGELAPQELFKGVVGESLNAGLPRIRKEDMRHFAKSPPEFCRYPA